MLQPLNKVLYSALQRIFGGDRIKVIAEGESAILRREKRLKTVGGKHEMVEYIKTVHPGEEYAVNCPYCNDTRHRLLINHRWGTKDDLGYLVLDKIQCFNEQCLSVPGRRMQLWQRIYGVNARSSAAKIQISPGKIVVDPTRAKIVSIPGGIWRLDELSVKQPCQQAIEYLEDRGHDPIEAGKVFGAGYCYYAPKFGDLVENRIYIPIKMENKLVGWQARYLGDVDWKQLGMPKYFSCPGMQKAKILYNIDEALKYRTLVIVEGPMDVWSVGPQGVGIIGKTLNEFHADYLREHFKGDSIVIMLDPVQDAAEKDKGKKHHIERAHDRLYKEFRGRLVRAYLPEELDPGSCDRVFLRDFMRQCAKTQGVPISFKRIEQACDD